MSIEKEIDQLAKSFADNSGYISEEEETQILETIKEVGLETVKKSMENMNETQLEVINKVLEKAVNLDKETMLESKKHTQEASEEISIVRDFDEKDEELVKEEAAKINHQGDISPEGREGQVIKSEEVDSDLEKGCEKLEKDEDEVEIPKKEAIKEHERLVNVLESESKADDKKEAKEQKKELKEMKKSMMKQYLENYIEGHTSMLETAIELKAQGFEKSEIKKALEAVDELLEKGRGKDKKPRKKRERPGRGEYDRKPDKRYAKESTQGVANRQAREAVEREDYEHADFAREYARDEARTRIDRNRKIQPKLVKSVIWADENSLIKSGRGGQNAHVSVDEYIYKCATEVPSEQKLEKSEPEKYDINDLIEKSMDYNEGRVKDFAKYDDFKKSEAGFNTKTVDNTLIAKSMGISEEEYNNLMGISLEKSEEGEAPGK